MQSEVGFFTWAGDREILVPFAVRPLFLIPLVCGTIALGAPAPTVQEAVQVRADLDAQVNRAVPAQAPPKLELLFEGMDPHVRFLHEGRILLDGHPLPSPPGWDAGLMPKERRVWAGRISPGPHVLAVKLTYAQAEFSGSFSPGLGVDQNVGRTFHFVAQPGLLLRIHTRVRPTDSGGLRLTSRLQPVLLPAEGAQPVVAREIPSATRPTVPATTPREPVAEPVSRPDVQVARAVRNAPPKATAPKPEPQVDPLALLRAELRGSTPAEPKVILTEPVRRPPPIVAPLSRLEQRILIAGMWPPAAPKPPENPLGPTRALPAGKPKARAPAVDPLTLLREQLRGGKAKPGKAHPSLAKDRAEIHGATKAPAPAVDPLALLRAKLRATSAKTAPAHPSAKHHRRRRHHRTSRRRVRHAAHHRRRRHHRAHLAHATHHRAKTAGANAATLRLRQLLKKAAAETSGPRVHPRFRAPRRSGISLRRFYGPSAMLQAPHGTPPGEPLAPSPRPLGSTVWIGILLGVGVGLLLGIAVLRNRRGRS